LVELIESKVECGLDSSHLTLRHIRRLFRFARFVYIERIIRLEIGHGTARTGERGLSGWFFTAASKTHKNINHSLSLTGVFLKRTRRIFQRRADDIVTKTPDLVEKSEIFCAANIQIASVHIRDDGPEQSGGIFFDGIREGVGVGRGYLQPVRRSKETAIAWLR
jgi:hypothetical protein